MEKMIIKVLIGTCLTAVLGFLISLPFACNRYNIVGSKDMGATDRNATDAAEDVIFWVTTGSAVTGFLVTLMFPLFRAKKP